MSTYTTQLREIIKTFTRPKVKQWFMDYELSDYLTPEQLELVNKNGLFDKAKLADLLIDHFYMREIGFESVGLFKHRLKTQMRAIMETEAQLLYSKSLEYDPLVNENYQEEIGRQKLNTGTTTSNSNGSGLEVGSNTPQGQINKTDILQGRYASQTSANEIENQSQADAKSNEQEIIGRTVKGNRGVIITQQRLVREWRELIISISRDVIVGLEPLFMGIF